MNTVKSYLKKLKKGLSRDRIKAFGTDMIWIITGSVIGAVAVVGIMEPNGLSAGGIVGIIRMLQKFVPLNFSSMYSTSTSSGEV